MLRRHRLPLGVFLVMVIALSAVFSLPAMANHSPGHTSGLSISPGLVGYLVGREFSVSVTVDSVSNLVGFDITLAYSTAVLDAVAPSLEGSLITQRGLAYFIFVNRTDSPPGTVRLSLTLLGGATLGDATNPASGPLYAIKFRAIGTGISVLDLNTDRLIDNQTNDISHTTADGSFDNTHNIRITSVVSEKTVIGQGFLGDILVSISNAGVSSETGTVTVTAGSMSVQTKSFTLGAGSLSTIRFTWNTATFPRADYVISAAATIAALDADPADNALTDGTVKVSIPGDIDGNCRTDIDDVLKVTTVWGSTPSSSNWFPNADINNNRVVDVDDVLVVTTKWGTRC